MAQNEQTGISAIAAIFFKEGEDVDCVLEEISNALQSKGYRVAGYLQREMPATNSCCSITDIESIGKGSKIRISQALGPGARGCRLDANGLAEASAALIRELEDGVDILILNRFGKGESEGQGFRAVIQKAMEMNVPVLTAVRNAYRPSWEEFGGEFAQIISHGTNDGLDWCLQYLKTLQPAK